MAYRKPSYEKACEQADRIQERNKKREMRQRKRGSKVKRSIITFVLIVITITLYFFCLYDSLEAGFLFESYGGIITSFVVTGFFVGVFLSLNYFFRKKARNRTEKKIVHWGVFILNLFTVPVIFLGIGFLFAKGFIPMEYYPFDTDGVSSLITSLKEFF